jgi:hypothetical protein
MEEKGKSDELETPKHKTLNDLLQHAPKEYIKMCRKGKERPATKEELLNPFKHRKTRYAYGERGDEQNCGVGQNQ